MTVVRTVAEVRRVLSTLRAHGRVGFVPTMGALHDGHLTLFRVARAECAVVVGSIFVNPRQFDDPVDLAQYPRDEDRDAALARDAGVDVLFVPAADEIYPRRYATTVRVAGPAEGFEGAVRRGHFDGVATVCLILFNIVAPDHVYLGQKDAQQVAVLRQLVRDLHLAVEVRVVPTVRDADGVARSSRNARLSPEERTRAQAIPRALQAALEAHHAGRDPVAAARTALTDLEIQYVDIADFHGVRTLVIAARAGRTRLIDNLPLDEPELAGLPHADPT